MAKVTSLKTTETTFAVPGVQSIDAKIAHLYLHSAVQIDSQSEKHIHHAKFRTVKTMYWVNGFSAVVIEAKTTHVIPAGAVYDSVLE